MHNSLQSHVDATAVPRSPLVYVHGCQGGCGGITAPLSRWINWMSPGRAYWVRCGRY